MVNALKKNKTGPGHVGSVVGFQFKIGWSIFFVIKKIIRKIGEI